MRFTDSLGLLKSMFTHTHYQNGWPRIIIINVSCTLKLYLVT